MTAKNPYYPAKSPYYYENYYLFDGVCSLCQKTLSIVKNLHFGDEDLPVNNLSCDCCGRNYGWCCPSVAYQGRDLCYLCNGRSFWTW